MEEKGYLELMRKILEQGLERGCRNGKTLSLFGERIEFDLKTGFPLLTTKRVFWRGVAEELFWFLRGSTNANELAEKGVNIWRDNTTRQFLDSVGLYALPEGHLGAGYGHCWKAYGGEYPSGAGGIDQIRYIVEQLQTNPCGRRALLCAWNPTQLHMAALPPCHYTYQFYLCEKRGLSCMMMMRSCDVAAGLPFNIASTALLTSLIAKIMYVEVDRVIVVTGDTHLYDVHMDGAGEQITRIPKQKPQLIIHKEAPPRTASVDEKVKWLESLEFSDVSIEGYECYPPIKYPMVA